MAVSILSPVNTHTLIPASRNAAIVVSTFSYNLSSIAVTPNISKSYSILSCSISINVYLSYIEISAF